MTNNSTLGKIASYNCDYGFSLKVKNMITNPPQNY